MNETSIEFRIGTLHFCVVYVTSIFNTPNSKQICLIPGNSNDSAIRRILINSRVRYRCHSLSRAFRTIDGSNERIIILCVPTSIPVHARVIIDKPHEFNNEWPHTPIHVPIPVAVRSIMVKTMCPTCVLKATVVRRT